MPHFTAQQLRNVAKVIFTAVGAPNDVASYVAESLVECNLMGHDSHGVLRIPIYVERVENGRINPAARPSILKETPATAVIKGSWTFGQVTARFATEVVIRKARETDIAAASMVECNHLGRLGEYTTMIALEGMIGMMILGGFSTSFTFVAPFGGAKPALGTNPYSFAVPAGAYEPFVADFATSIVAEGKLKVAQAKGEPVPEGLVIDSDGRPSTDPNAYRKGGSILPFGGHKGYAMGLFADLLGSLLAGAEILGQPPYTYGACVIALRVDAFRPLDEFTAAVDKRLAEIKAIPPSPGFDQVLIPGEPEARTKAQRLQTGIPVAEETWEKIEAIADKYSVNVSEILTEGTGNVGSPVVVSTPIG
jgi:LDH2 family malate/lactate/ureidoglycolate dehydrogenase